MWDDCVAHAQERREQYNWAAQVGVLDQTRALDSSMIVCCSLLAQ